MALFTDELGLISGSVVIYKDFSDFASSSRLTISPDFSNTGKYDFIYETTGSTPIKLLTLSSSGNDPRVGIGNENPQTTLDIKDVSDTTIGAEILVRSSRTTKGGDIGDAAGKILFVIDSGSYVDVKTSGSVATITTEVTAINDKMAGGDLIFKVSDTELSDPDPATVLRFSRNTGVVSFTNNFATMSAALHVIDNITSTKGIIGDTLTSNATITATSYVYADNIRIGTNTVPTSKGLYVSGNITSSNDLSIRGFSSVSSSLASTARFPYTGSALITGSLTVTGSVNSNGGFTGSLLGTSSWATNALTASFVNTLNQNLVITGAVSIGTSSVGPNENTLTLGARDSVNEGGQLGLNAPGGTYTSASFIDLYQNRLRILRGTNAGSTGEVATWNLGTLQMVLPAYTNASSFPGTATANLAVDSGGNVITVSTAGGTVFPYVGNAVITGSLTTTGIIYAQPNGGMYFQGGDDAALYDINVANHMGIYGVQDSTVGAIKLGSNGPILYGSGSKLGIGTTNPNSASLTVNGNVWANSFTGSLNGTASWALNVVGGGGSTFPYTGSAIISGSLTVTGSTAITGGFEALGAKGSKIQLGTYNIGYDIIGFDTFFITGAGLIISGNMPDQNHHNLLKIGNVEMVDINTALTTNEFLIHNVNTLRITSGADGGNITTNNQLLKIGGGEFYVYRAGGADSAGIIQSAGSETKITDTFVTLYGTSGSYFYIPNTNEITTLNGTDYLMGFVANPSPPGLSYKIKADKFIWATGSNQIISGGLIVTGSLRASSITSSLLGTASYAITASYALSSAGGGGGVTINNNTDNYIITATGTANTLNGEANLQYSGSTLINRGRSLFVPSGGGTGNTSHQFRQTTGDTFGFIISDADGEDLVKVEGTLANSDAKITIGDVGNAYNSTNIIVDDPNNKIELIGKVYPNSLAVKATTLSTVGSFDIGSRIADDWSTTGPTLTAGRIVYFSGSTQWTQAQANTSGSSYGMLGVVTSAESQREVLIEGTIQISGSALSSGIAGQPVYLSPSTAGQVTLTAPTTTGQIVRVLGFITKANSNIMYFRPDNNWIVI